MHSPHTFEDGDVLDVPGRPRVIHTRGHTRGEVVFYLPTRGTLFSDDTPVTRDLYTGRTGTPQITRPRRNDDFALAQRSPERIQDLGAVRMLPGHGEPWDGDMRDAVAGALDLSAV